MVGIASGGDLHGRSKTQVLKKPSSQSQLSSAGLHQNDIQNANQVGLDDSKMAEYG
jgi:hypothetical protein